jgi:mannose-1-phosphate guanylyltransferase
MKNETMKNRYCVIMAGGIGSRFWPMSRTVHPKQFQDILGTGETLLQQTFNRFLKLCPQENIFVVTNEDYKELVQKQLEGISPQNILLEPMRKNTAPCVAYASYKIAQLNPDAITVVAPSDHLITKEDAFIEAIESCYKQAELEDCLLTIGLQPTNPNTGYGYIQFENLATPTHDLNIKQVKTFTEKPDLEMAKSFIESGDFLWNSGIFIWSIKSIITAFEKYAPRTAEIFDEGELVYGTAQETEFIEKAYSRCKNISIDYAIMEQAQNVYVRSSALGWSDLGTWGSLYEHIPKDENENAIVGKNVMVYDSKNCIVNVPKNKLVVMQGLEDFIVVESDGILLICKKQSEQEIKTFVSDIQATKGDEFI